ncbi:bifunctional 4-hydroxy-2-oxoglutarate aldolase/2-dehydro-3-deoxy-phosphogluconate aldolase [Propionibacteriaceae bacterium Y1685]
MNATLDLLATTGILAVVRAPSREAALRVTDALKAGGVTGIEITYSTPDAAAVISELAEVHGDSILLGAGTVTSPAQAVEAADAGARFLVSPGTTAPVVEAMRATGLTVMSGVMTPSEVMMAQDLGVEVLKLFPASHGGPGLMKALRGPFGEVPMMPTGGVNADNLKDWFDAGAVAVGAGGDLVSGAAMADGDWVAIEEQARRFSAALAEARHG